MTLETPSPSHLRGDPKYTWDDTIAAIGKNFSEGRERVAGSIERIAVNRFCEAWEIGLPIYWYEDAAKQAGYKGVVAPWSSVKQTFTGGSRWTPGQPTRFPLGTHKDSLWIRETTPDEQEESQPEPPTTGALVTDIQIEFFEPVCLGDSLRIKGRKLVNVRVRQTRIGFGAFINHEQEIYNQRGDLVARTNTGVYHYNPGEKAPQQRVPAGRRG